MSTPLQRYIADPTDVERYDVCSNAKDFEPDGVFYLAADVARLVEPVKCFLREFILTIPSYITDEYKLQRRAEATRLLARLEEG